MDTEILMSSTNCTQMSKKFRIARDDRASFPLCERGDARGVVHTIVSRAIDQRLPCGGARGCVVQVGVVGFRDALQEQRIGGMVFVERSKQRDCLGGFVYVPDVDLVQLK